MASGRAGSRLPLDWWRDPRFDVGSAARDLLTRLVSYSAEYTTDGLIPASAYQSQLAAVGDTEAGSRLVAAGHLRLANGAALIVEWQVFNLSADQVQRLKLQRAGASTKRWELARASGSDTEPQSDSHTEPDTEPHGDDASRTPSRNAGRITRSPYSVDRDSGSPDTRTREERRRLSAIEMAYQGHRLSEPEMVALRKSGSWPPVATNGVADDGSVWDAPEPAEVAPRTR